MLYLCLSATMSLRHRACTLSKPRPLPPSRLEIALFAGLFHRGASIDGTGKRRLDGEYADTRIGKSVSLKWANERLRQTMLLINEFRTNCELGHREDP